MNADEAASAIARIVGASGIVLLTDVHGVLDASRRLIPELDAARVDALIADGQTGAFDYAFIDADKGGYAGYY